MMRALHRARRTLVPASVLLTVTHRCQLECAHCYQSVHESEDLGTAELLQLFDELQLLGTLELTFTGGEALLRPDLLELIAEARQRAFSVCLFSNGGPITPEVARRLRELRVGSVEISLHAAHAALHDGFTGRRGSFDRAVRAIGLLDDQGIPVIVKSSIVRCNAGEVLELRALFARRPRVRFLADVLLHGRDDGTSVLSQRVTPEQLQGWFTAQAAAAGEEELQQHLARLADAPPESVYETQQPCGAGRTFATVEPNGDVLACTHLRGLTLGNLRKSSFSSIWLDSPAARALRSVSLARYEECRGCEFRHVCSKCPALSADETGSITGHSRQVCDRTKAFWGAVKARGPGAAALAPPPASPAPAASAGAGGSRSRLSLPVLAAPPVHG